MGLNRRRFRSVDHYWRIMLLFFTLTILSISNGILCGSKTSLEDTSDYKIDFFKKTGKYPSIGYLESHGIYGTPLILRTQDSTLWIILFGVCLAAFIIGIGIFVVANFGGDVKQQEDRLEELESNEYFYDPLESPEEDIRRLNKLQCQFVESLNNPNPNNYSYHHHPQFSQFGNYYNLNQQYYSSRSFK
ncbi:hypothetical protein OJ253_1669 [Cryptosporidium canis]|uniref:Uncharacterized protein n=1 Tax=Cryptosporidium canis TaxID=195482 RepID=A0A9D5DN43_9CRYT|nr:hypothetical protein OJ253_1669 [Cryptosporidium canis]